MKIRFSYYGLPGTWGYGVALDCYGPRCLYRLLHGGGVSIFWRTYWHGLCSWIIGWRHGLVDIGPLAFRVWP